MEIVCIFMMVVLIWPYTSVKSCQILHTKLENFTHKIGAFYFMWYITKANLTKNKLEILFVGGVRWLGGLWIELTIWEAIQFAGNTLWMAAHRGLYCYWMSLEKQVTGVLHEQRVLPPHIEAFKLFHLFELLSLFIVPIVSKFLVFPFKFSTISQFGSWDAWSVDFPWGNKRRQKTLEETLSLDASFYLEIS